MLVRAGAVMLHRLIHLYVSRLRAVKATNLSACAVGLMLLQVLSGEDSLETADPSVQTMATNQNPNPTDHTQNYRHKIDKDACSTCREDTSMTGKNQVR